MHAGIDLPSLRSLVCPVLVGRGTIVETLRHALDTASNGDGRIVLISGEAGIGKSRLAAEGRAYAAERGFLVLEGACFPQDRARPYAPILDLLRARFAGQDADSIARQLGPFAREIAWLQPDLGPRPLEDGPAVLEAEQQRGRLFAALSHVLSEPALRQPLLVLVEDVQWADDASLDVLLHLARRAGGRLAILATCRAEDVDARLSAWLAQVDRGRLGHEIPLMPLGRDETAAMVGAMLGERTATPARVQDAIFEVSEGNPFVVEELIAALARAGALRRAGQSGDAWEWIQTSPSAWGLPRSLRGAVLQRVARLSTAAREVVTLAAVVGRRFDFELLQRLARLDERMLLGVMKELIAAQLVVEEAPDRFAFRHGLFRRAIYAELLAREKMALHRAVAEAAESLDGAAAHLGAGPGTRRDSGLLESQRLDDLAYHFSQARVWGKALTYAQRAGERARRLHAPRAAVEHFTRAFEAAEHLETESDEGLTRDATDGAGTPYASAPVSATALIAAHHERGRAYEQLGDFDSARADYERAVTLAREAGLTRSEWAALIDLGSLWTSRDYVQAGTAYQQALELARSIREPRLVGHSLNHVGNWQINTAQPRDAIALHREAMAIFEQLGDRHGLAATLDLLGMACFLSADLPGSMAAFERAAALFRALDDRPRLISCLAMLASRGGDDLLGSSVPDAAPFAEGVRNAEQALELARSIEWRAGEAFTLSCLARNLGLRGQYARALELGRRSLRIAEEIEHRQWTAEAHWVLGALHLDLLALPEARRHLTRALELGREVRSAFWVQIVTAYLAWAHVQAGEPEQAAALLGTVSTGLATPGDGGADDETATVTGRPVQSLGERWLLFARMQHALAVGDPGLALRCIDRLSAPSLDGSPSQETPRPALARGRALTALGRHAEAEVILRGVEEVTRKQGTRSLLWRAHVALGDLYRAWGRAEEAEAQDRAARALADELAAGLPDPALKRSLLEGVAALLPRPSRIATRRAEAARFGGLSLREREVAMLLARGLTNREIADELVVGERTIETHASNILSKLRLASRREVARWVAEHGPLV